MQKKLYKLAILGTICSLPACEQVKEDCLLKVTNSYSLQSCDKETKAHFIEMQNKSNHYTGFIQTGNEHKIPNIQKKFKIGTHTTIEIAKKHFDGFYLTYE